MMYDLFGAKAVSGVLVLILPKAVAVIIISVLAVRELFRSSGAIFVFSSSEEIRTMTAGVVSDFTV